MKMLSLFYEQVPKRDRWIPYDRYIRYLIRYIRRGNPPSGQMRVFLNLCKGLEKIGAAFRVNDYGYIQKNQNELACIIGKENVLNKITWRNPILYGPNVYDHPILDPDLLDRLPICRVLIASDWFKDMCYPFWGDRITLWPAGIDTDYWKPAFNINTDIDFLVYNKVMWNYQDNLEQLITPIREVLARRGYRTKELRYGSYREGDYHSLLQRSKAMIFLCEHETQGFARMQASACGIPIFAWDQEGYWLDPSFYPDKVRFSPVTSVPYWDDTCGVKFKNIHEFNSKLDIFLAKLCNMEFNPRSFITNNFTLEICANNYVNIANSLICN